MLKDGKAAFLRITELLHWRGEVGKGCGGKGGSLFLWNREKNVGFAYTMSGMMNGGHGGPRTAPFFDVLRHA